MAITVTQIMKESADREAIRDCLYRYSRGIDRKDEEALRSAYWPDATDDHGEFKGTADEFVAYAMPRIRNMDQTMHYMANILIRLEGDAAKVETYFFGFHRIDINGVMRDIVAGGRYADQFAKRNDEWRILKRLVVVDWFREYDDSADWAKSLIRAELSPRGVPKPEDKTYSWLGLVA